MKRHFLGFPFLLALLFVFGCGLLVEEGRAVVAKVGKQPIRLNDLLGRIRSLPFEQRAATNDPNPTIRLQARRSSLESLVNEELLAQEAKARKIQASDEEVALLLKQHDEAEAPQASELTEGLVGSSGHEHAHDKQEHSRTEINEVRLQLMVQKMLDSELNEETRKRYYDGHPEEFAVSPPQVVCELLVTKIGREDVIKKISEKAEREKKTLKEVAASSPFISEIYFCGETPPAPLNRMVPIMKEKVEKLEVGQISEPFVLDAGGLKQRAVTRLVRYVSTVPYERVRGMINKKVYDDFLKNLHQKYEVVYFQDKLDYRLEG
jgi:hypothetical protein